MPTEHAKRRLTGSALKLAAAAAEQSWLAPIITSQAIEQLGITTLRAADFSATVTPYRATHLQANAPREADESEEADA